MMTPITPPYNILVIDMPSSSRIITQCQNLGIQPFKYEPSPVELYLAPSRAATP